MEFGRQNWELLEYNSSSMFLISYTCKLPVQETCDNFQKKTCLQNFLQDFIVILKREIQNYLENLQEMSLRYW